jgi:hypothetical protein
MVKEYETIRAKTQTGNEDERTIQLIQSYPKCWFLSEVTHLVRTINTVRAINVMNGRMFPQFLVNFVSQPSSFLVNLTS